MSFMSFVLRELKVGQLKGLGVASAAQQCYC